MLQKRTKTADVSVVVIKRSLHGPQTKSQRKLGTNTVVVSRVPSSERSFGTRQPYVFPASTIASQSPLPGRHAITSSNMISPISDKDILIVADDDLFCLPAEATYPHTQSDSLETAQSEINSSEVNLIQSLKKSTGKEKQLQKQDENKRKRDVYYDKSATNKTRKSFELTEGTRNHRYHRRRKFCCAYSPCCCLTYIFGFLLFLAALAALLVGLLTRQKATINTTTTTSTSTTTTTATTATTTTTTSTTSTTSETTTTSTSTTSETSTTTTSTTSATTTTTTVTTPTPPCTPVSVGTSSTLFTATSASTSTYQCQAFEWTSPTTGLVTLAFQLRHDPHTWFLDDVSIYHGAVQMLTNGGFESGTMSPWVRTTPNGACSGWPSQISTTSNGVPPRTGIYYYIDGSYGCADRISQSFVAIAGDIYIVSFWIRSGSSSSGVSASITLS